MENERMSREGLKLLESYFFEARSKTITKNNSWYETQRNPEKWEKLLKTANRIKSPPYQTYQLWYGTVNQFRPAVAKWLYTRYKPTSIIDFSAGWGGRCLAAIQMGIQYTGIDSNVSLKPCYEALLRDHPGNVQMYYQASEAFDFSTVSYDMIFTSPPYFMIERYEHMPTYQSKTHFLTTFFQPVIQKSWENLKTEGHLCLNMPEEMYDAIKEFLPPLLETLTMRIGSRFAKTSNAKRSENIYVWKKN